MAHAGRGRTPCRRRPALACGIVLAALTSLACATFGRGRFSYVSTRSDALDVEILQPRVHACYCCWGPDPTGWPKAVALGLSDVPGAQVLVDVDLREDVVILPLLPTRYCHCVVGSAGRLR